MKDGQQGKEGVGLAGAGRDGGAPAGLSARERARLDVLRPLVAKGRIQAGSAEAEEYAVLKEREEEEQRAAGEVVIPVSGLASKREQAAFYQVSERTIGLWRAKSAPLGRPRDMIGWWAKAFPGKPVNPGILASVGKVPTLAKASAPAAPAVAAAPLKLEQEVVVTPVAGPVETGFDATHQRMLGEEARLYARIQKLEAEAAELRRYGDVENADLKQSEADGLRPQWVRLSESLGQADTRQIRNALQRGDLVHRAKIEQEYATLLRAHPEVLRHELKAVRERLEPVPPAAVWDSKVDAVLDDLFRRLPDKLMEAA